MRVFTIGHGTRAASELVECLAAAGVATLVDVRRFPGSRRNPQFEQAALAETLAEAGIAYVHAVELGGRRRSEPGEERFGCIRTAAFRSYVARMGAPEWQAELEAALAEPRPCFMCAETLWWRCHRRFIAELLLARGHSVTHLVRPHELTPHRLLDESNVRGGRLYVCGELVA
ncbi:MAG: DUF488 family protein [Actinobacteria bacterium]|nr:DUF488 family protein [Actinomycetota bacterium]